jgi:hypothetical protein
MLTSRQPRMRANASDDKNVATTQPPIQKRRPDPKGWDTGTCTSTGFDAFQTFAVPSGNQVLRGWVR